MKILSISDVVVPYIHSIQIANLFEDIDLVIGCGDLPYAYQEFIVSMLNVPLFYVHGNHDKVLRKYSGGKYSEPNGGTNLHDKVIRYHQIVMAGIEGSIRYKPEGRYQYTQREMWQHVFRLVPGLFRNYMLTGRYLDVFVTHAPPWGTHDKEDLPHQGIKAFAWFNKVFQPAYHFHGHIHVYRPGVEMVSKVDSTVIINTYGYRETTLEIQPARIMPGRRSHS